MAKRTAIKKLNGSCVDATPVTYDWSEGFGTVWTSYEAEECNGCHKVVAGMSGSEDRHCDLDNDSECEELVNIGEGPMMNYYYPLGDGENQNPLEMAELISHLPLCIVKFDDTDKFALALTGGGMDLSWEICRAYMHLGYLPPVHFANLPDMCQHWNPTVAWVIAGCRESFRRQARQSKWGLSALARLTNGIKVRTAEKKG